MVADDRGRPHHRAAQHCALAAEPDAGRHCRRRPLLGARGRLVSDVRLVAADCLAGVDRGIDRGSGGERARPAPPLRVSAPAAGLPHRRHHPDPLPRRPPARARASDRRGNAGDRLMPIIVRLDVMLALRKTRSKELAAGIGITEANLSLLKSGKVKGIRFSTLEAICEALECKPGDILDYEPGEQATGVTSVDKA